MTELKMKHVLIFTIVAFMLYHFINSGLSCSCAKWRNMEGFDVSAESAGEYCGGRTKMAWTKQQQQQYGLDDFRCEDIPNVEQGYRPCDNYYDQNGFLCRPPLPGSRNCTYTPLTLTDTHTGANIKIEGNWGDPDNLDRAARRLPSLGGYYKRCDPWPKRPVNS